MRRIVFTLFISIFASLFLSSCIAPKEQQDAISKVQMYQMKSNIMSIDESTIGMSLSVYVEKYLLKLMKAGRMVERGHWSATENNNKTGYLVDYKFKLGGEENVFEWEVKGETIVPINGRAKSVTPEIDTIK